MACAHAAHLSLRRLRRSQRRALERFDVERPGAAHGPADGRLGRVPAAAPDQYPPRFRRQFNDAGDVLGRQQPRRFDRQAAGDGLSGRDVRPRHILLRRARGAPTTKGEQDMKPIRSLYAVLAVAAIAAIVTACMSAPQGGGTAGASDIAGTVTGANGPEAGVWVIAETSDLPTKFAKVVVTDDRGRFLVPDLPKANYSVWVRGYGLVDSPKVQSAPGSTLNLAAVAAPNEAAAAEYYPGMYWYSLLQIPPAGDFPGTGEKGNGIPAVMKTQAYWIDTVKNSCQSCHALGSHGVRTVPKEFGHGLAAWARRTQSGQAMSNMALTLGRLGPEKGLQLFGDWTDRIAAGELPFAKPERPKGVERNVVISMWDWSTPKYYLHDAVSTDKRNPTVNANGLIYGAPEESTDLVAVLDPVKNVASQLKHPYRDPNTPSSKTLPM